MSFEEASPKKRTAIGDTHGRRDWERFIDLDFDEFYFVGDYFDDYESTAAFQQIENFLKIVDYARRDSRIKLCLGNHDYHYLPGVEDRYSGYQAAGRWDITPALVSALDVLKPIYVTEDNYIISHAGVSQTFLNVHGLTHPLDINEAFSRDKNILSWVGPNPYGDSVDNGPIWIRPKSLLEDKVPGFKQIVGHTQVQEIHTVEGVTFIDVGSSKEVFWF